MYLPESKYSKPKYTRGDEFRLPDGKMYTGWYFDSYSGRSFTGKSPDEKSVQIISVAGTHGEELEQPDDTFIFTSEIILPTEQNYSEGKFTRFIIQDKRNKAIIEVGATKAKKALKFNYLTVNELSWVLEGPADDVKHGPYIFFGAGSQNKINVEELEKKVPGLKNFIKSYAEFVK